MARYQMWPDVQKSLMVPAAGDNMVAEIVVGLFIIVHLLSRTMTFQQQQQFLIYVSRLGQQTFCQDRLRRFVRKTFCQDRLMRG